MGVRNFLPLGQVRLGCNRARFRELEFSDFLHGVLHSLRLKYAEIGLFLHHKRGAKSPLPWVFLRAFHTHLAAVRDNRTPSRKTSNNFSDLATIGKIPFATSFQGGISPLGRVAPWGLSSPCGLFGYPPREFRGRIHKGISTGDGLSLESFQGAYPPPLWPSLSPSRPP